MPQESQPVGARPPRICVSEETSLRTEPKRDDRSIRNIERGDDPCEEARFIRLVSIFRLNEASSGIQ